MDEPPDDKERAEAEDAIRQIGTKAIPYLVKWIGSDAPTQGIFYRMGCAVLVQFHLSWQFPQDKHWRRGFIAPQALGLLRPKAESKVPELAKLLHDKRRPRNAERAADALMYLGDAGLPALLSILTNQSADLKLRNRIALECPSMENLTTTRPMERLLADPDATVRQCATNALREIYPSAFGQDGTLQIEKSWANH